MGIYSGRAKNLNQILAGIRDAMALYKKMDWGGARHFVSGLWRAGYKVETSSIGKVFDAVSLIDGAETRTMEIFLPAHPMLDKAKACREMVIKVIESTNYPVPSLLSTGCVPDQAKIYSGCCAYLAARFASKNFNVPVERVVLDWVDKIAARYPRENTSPVCMI